MDIFIHCNLVHILQLAKLEWKSEFKNACQSLCQVWRLSKYLIPVSFHVFRIVWLLPQLTESQKLPLKFWDMIYRGCQLCSQLSGVFSSSWLWSNNNIFYFYSVFIFTNNIHPLDSTGVDVKIRDMLCVKLGGLWGHLQYDFQLM